MRLNDILKISLQSLRRNRVRTALSLLGIVIGVFAVTVILSMGVAVKAAVVGYVNDMVGQDLGSINPAVPRAPPSSPPRPSPHLLPPLGAPGAPPAVPGRLGGAGARRIEGAQVLADHV